MKNLLTLLALFVAKYGKLFMSVIDKSGYTWSGKQAKTAIIEQAYSKPIITRFATVQDNIVDTEQIAFLSRVTGVTRKDTGSGVVAQNITSNLSDKTWNPVSCIMWVSDFYQNVESAFFTWGLAKGYSRADLQLAKMSDEDPMGYWTEFVEDQMADAAHEDMLRNMWLGDTAGDTVANGGVFVDGAAKTLNTILNGFWKQILTGVAATDIPRHDISANQQGTFENQLTGLSAGESLEIFKALLNNSDDRLKFNDDAIIVCTSEIFENWQDYKESKNLESSFKNEDTMLRESIYRDVPIVPLAFLGRAIKTYENDGTKYNNPHRAVLTTPRNMLVGVDVKDGFNQFESWYDKTTRLVHKRGMYKMDTKIVQEDFMHSVAY